mgnify:CR=1 FL=1
MKSKYCNYWKTEENRLSNISENPEIIVLTNMISNSNRVQHVMILDPKQKSEIEPMSMNRDSKIAMLHINWFAWLLDLKIAI